MSKIALNHDNSVDLNKKNWCQTFFYKKKSAKFLLAEFLHLSVLAQKNNARLKFFCTFGKQNHANSRADFQKVFKKFVDFFSNFNLNEFNFSDTTKTLF